MTSVYSVWLVPDGPPDAVDWLDDRIDELSARYGGPIFDPHLTLVGTVAGDPDDLAATAGSLAADRDPLDLSTLGVSCSTTRYQCVFVLVEPTPALLDLRGAAVDAFDAEANFYVPHLSLCYGDIPVADRPGIVDSLDAAGVPERVSVGSLALVETTGPAPSWTVVDEWPL